MYSATAMFVASAAICFFSASPNNCASLMQKNSMQHVVQRIIEQVSNCSIDQLILYINYYSLVPTRKVGQHQSQSDAERYVDHYAQSMISTIQAHSPFFPQSKYLHTFHCINSRTPSPSLLDVETVTKGPVLLRHFLEKQDGQFINALFMTSIYFTCLTNCSNAHY